MRLLNQYLTIDFLKLIQYAHFQSVINYGTIFGVNQPFKLRFSSSKKILRIMLGIGCRSICRIWFTKYDILTVPSLYILALAMSVINNYSYFQTN